MASMSTSSFTGSPGQMVALGPASPNLTARACTVSRSTGARGAGTHATNAGANAIARTAMERCNTNTTSACRREPRQRARSTPREVHEDSAGRTIDRCRPFTGRDAKRSGDSVRKRRTPDVELGGDGSARARDEETTPVGRDPGRTIVAIGVELGHRLHVAERGTRARARCDPDVWPPFPSRAGRREVEAEPVGGDHRMRIAYAGRVELGQEDAILEAVGA